MQYFLPLLLWSLSGEVAVGGEPVLEAIPLEAATDGATTLRLAAPDGNRNYVLIAGCLDPTGQPTTVEIRRGQAPKTNLVAHYPLAVTQPPDWWRWRVANDRAALQRSREREALAPATWSAARFAPHKSFHLFVGETDLYDAGRYIEVVADLAKVGRHCIIYTDQKDDVERSVVEEIARVFDEQVYPSARATFGRHRDVDRDGKFAILMTTWLSRLSDGKVALSGFVRGADFYRDVEAPFSNQCDMLYLNASLEPGPHLTTILAHEYTHAITFCEHVFGEYLPGGQGRDDEAWLSEAVAHLAENLHGDGWSNLDYRISTFLSDTNRYRLVVPDYFHEGLWRCHGGRGATYLFLRYCVDRFGEGILTELSQSNLNGVENIETVTQTTFAELFRGWSVWIATAAYTTTDNASIVSLHGRLGDRLLTGARATELARDQSVALDLAPTSFGCVRIPLSRGQCEDVTIDAPAGKNVQLTLLRLPDDLPRVRAHLVATTTDESGQFQLQLTSSEPVQWREISWEYLVLDQTGPADRDRYSKIVDADEILKAVAPPHFTRFHESDPIDLSEFHSQAGVIKALGVDLVGRPITAWAVVPPSELVTAHK